VILLSKTKRAGWQSVPLISASLLALLGRNGCTKQDPPIPADYGPWILARRPRPSVGGLRLTLFSSRIESVTETGQPRLALGCTQGPVPWYLSREGKMETSSDYRISSTAELRSIIGEPGELVPKKVMHTLDQMAADFIRRSPFLVLATTDAEGNLDASPKGGSPGFVAIEDELTLAIPDRKGNKLIFGLQNILANPHVGLIFMIPGTDETLRVNGTAELTSDPAVCERLTARGAAAKLAIRVHIEQCFFHCAKAFLRSQLWKPETWTPHKIVSFGKQFAAKTGASDDVAKQIDEAIARDYRENL
jgi:uncharacterized protein